MVRGGSHCQVRVQFNVRCIKGKEYEKWFKVADLSPKLFGNYPPQMVTKPDQAGSKYWFPGFGFDSGPNLQPCDCSYFFHNCLPDLHLHQLETPKTSHTCLKKRHTMFSRWYQSHILWGLFQAGWVFFEWWVDPNHPTVTSLSWIFLSRQPIREPQKEYCWWFRNHPAKATRHGPKTM